MAQSNSLPMAIFAKLLPREFLLASLEASEAGVSPVRTNGRLPDQARQLRVNTACLSHAHGSALVRNGDTTVICGVRGEILPVDRIPRFQPRSKAELRDYDLLVPNIELATGSSPQFLPGKPPTTLAQTLSTRVYSLLHSCRLLDAEDLRIWYTPPSSPFPDSGDDDNDNDHDHDDHGDDGQPEAEIKAYWTLYIDLLFISFDGNPLDAAWVAVLAALRNTKLPAAAWDPDREMVVCSRARPATPLRVSGWPVACTAAVLLGDVDDGAGRAPHWILLDPDRLEEKLCGEAVTMVVDRSHPGETALRSLSKSGGTAIGPGYLKEFVGLAERRWDHVHEALTAKADPPT